MPVRQLVLDAVVPDRLPLHEPDLQSPEQGQHAPLLMYGGTTMSRRSRGAGPSIAQTTHLHAVGQRPQGGGEFLGGDGNDQRLDRTAHPLTLSRPGVRVANLSPDHGSVSRIHGE